MENINAENVWNLMAYIKLQPKELNKSQIG